MFFPKRAYNVTLFLSLLVALTASANVSAQTTTRKVVITGRVFDQSRAAIPGAQVVIARNGSDFSVSTTTDARGEFSLTVELGENRVTTTADGFSTKVQTINFQFRTANLIEIVLEVAEANAVVTITDGAGYLTEAVSSAMHRPTSLRDIPQSINVVSKEQIKDQSLQSISDVVAYVPGVTSHQGENNRDQLIFRGNSSSADFFVNGVRDDVQYFRDLYNVDRIEAIKGPNSMIFGRGGGGGVINRVTKEAGFSSFREITAQGGSFGNKRFTTDLDQSLNGKVALRFNGLYENSNSFRKYVGVERYAVNPTVTWAPTDKTRVTSSYEFFRDRRVADRGIPSFQLKPADLPIETFFGDPDNSRVRADVNLASLTIDHTKGRLNIRNRTMLGDYDRFYQNYVPGVVTADKTKVALTSYNNSTKRRNLFNQTDATFDGSTGSVKHNFLIGAEFGRQLTDNLRNTGFFNNTTTSIFVPYDNPTISTPVTFRPSATDANNHLKTNLGAVYAQDQLEISRYFQVVTGIRFDYFDLNFHNNRTGENLRRIDRLVSPRVGVIVKPVNELSVYANYAVAYLPSSGDQFSSLTTITQQVKPEKFNNYELGAKWDIRRNLALTTAAYRQDRTNTRATDPSDPTRIVQTGSQRTNGFELGLNGTLTNRWNVVGGYAYQDASITHDTTAAKAGAQVAQVPHHTFSLWNNYRVWQRLALGMGIIRRSDMFAAIDNTVVLPGYTRADAAVFYSIGEHWRIQANIQNLFDTRYYINADNNNNISPGSPRGFRLGLTARF
jgi:catecholate siderophore receptor